MLSPEFREPSQLNLAQQRLVRNTMFDAFFDYVCPETGTIDLATGHEVINEAYNAMLNKGLPEEGVKKLGAKTIVFTQSTRHSFASLTPELFLELTARAEPAEIIYQSTYDAFKRQMRPWESPYNLHDEALEEELEDNMCLFIEAGIEPDLLMLVASTKAHIDVQYKAEKELEMARWHDQDNMYADDYDIWKYME